MYIYLFDIYRFWYQSNKREDATFNDTCKPPHYSNPNTTFLSELV
jgi:hypothetical protein